VNITKGREERGRNSDKSILQGKEEEVFLLSEGEGCGTIS